MVSTFGLAAITGIMIGTKTGQAWMTYDTFFCVHIGLVVIAIFSYCSHGIQKEFDVFPINGAVVAGTAIICLLLYAVNWDFFRTHHVQAEVRLLMVPLVAYRDYILHLRI
jgi:hypothetical protein